MRRTALALFVVEPTHLRCEKLDPIQAKSKIRIEASVGGFAVGIAAGCVARKFELLNSFRGVVTCDCRDHLYDRSRQMVYLSPPPPRFVYCGG